MRTLAPLLALLLAAGPGAAQLITDRPDFVESSRSVGVGTFQLETSLAVSESGDLTTWSTPTLARYGMGQGWELRLELPGFIRVGDPVDVTGFGDAAVGVKKAFAQARADAPTYGVLVHVDLPTGSSDVSQDGLRPSLRGVVEWGLSPLLSAGVMAGVKSDRLGAERFTSGILAGVVGQSWSPVFRTYTELALAQIAGDEYGGNVGSFNTGGAYLLNDETQLDVGLSFGITEGASDFVVAVGFSRRFPG